MNNKNHSQHSDGVSGRTPSNSLWANFVEQYGQRALSEDSDATRPDPKIDLTSELLDDLELNGQLRMLGKMSGAEEPFTKKVVAQTHPDSVSFEPDRPRLPFIKPSFMASTPEAITETSLPPATDELVDNRVHDRVDNRVESPADRPSISPAAPSVDLPRRRKITLLASLTATVLVGCFIGSVWWSGAAPEIADAPSQASNGLLKGIADQVNNPQVDTPGVILTSEEDTDRLTDDQQLAAGPKEENYNASPSTALTSDSVREIWHQFLESTNDPDMNPTLVDVASKTDAVDEATKPSIAPLAGGSDLEGQIAEPLRSSYRLGSSKFDWNLAINYRTGGMGSVALNGKPVQAIFLQDNTVFLLRRIAGELQRRVQFFENRLDAGISGSIEVGSAKFRFENIGDLEEAIDKVGEHIDELEIGALPLGDLMRLRAKYRQLMWANRKNIGSINLANKNLAFYTEDEAFTICSVLALSLIHI